MADRDGPGNEGVESTAAAHALGTLGGAPVAMMAFRAATVKERSRPSVPPTGGCSNGSGRISKQCRDPFAGAHALRPAEAICDLRVGWHAHAVVQGRGEIGGADGTVGGERAFLVGGAVHLAATDAAAGEHGAKDVPVVIS